MGSNVDTISPKRKRKQKLTLIVPYAYCLSACIFLFFPQMTFSLTFIHSICVYYKCRFAAYSNLTAKNVYLVVDVFFFSFFHLICRSSEGKFNQQMTFIPFNLNLAKKLRKTLNNFCFLGLHHQIFPRS